MSPFVYTGVCTTRYLKQIRYPTRVLNHKIGTGELLKVRDRWYAEPGTDQKLISAVRRHCLLSGVHALGFYGAWVPPHGREQLVRLANRQVPEFDGDLFRSHAILVSDAPFGIVPWKAALRHAMPHLETPDLVAIVEGLLSPTSALAIPKVDVLTHIGSKKWGPSLLRLMDPRSESGIETVTRVRLILAGHSVEIQRVLPNNQRMDVLIDNKVALEVDSKYHADPGQYARDNRKGILIANQRYIPLRASYQDITQNWDQVYRAIRQMLAE